MTRGWAASALLLAGLAGCAARGPGGASAAAGGRSDLRLCLIDDTVGGERGELLRKLLEKYRAHFAGAVLTTDSRKGRECDVEARTDSTMSDEELTLRSAYDGSLLSHVAGPLDLLPTLAAVAVARGTEAYRLVAVQRAEGPR